MDKTLEAFQTLHEQNMAQLGQTGVIAQQNFNKVVQFSDYRYLQDMNNISLPEALGNREVMSKETPAGPSVIK